MHLNLTSVLLIVASFFLALSAYAQAERVRTEYETSKDCKYVELTRKDLVEERRGSTVEWDGECKEGFITGYGTLVIKTPEGIIQTEKVNFANGLENGEGEATQTTANSISTFVGKWEKGYRVYGTQEIKYKDQSFVRYTGGFKNSKFDGFGKFANSGGVDYEGNFADGMFSGKGKYTNYEGTYIGGFKNNRFYGTGIFIFRTGLVKSQEGIYENGQLNGVGKTIYSDGSVSEGIFKNNSLNGRGVLIQANGDKYEGVFANNKLVIGKITHKSGVIKEGNFEDGFSLDGQGSIKGLRGEFWEGIFAKGVLVRGKYKSSTGEIQEGTFVGLVLDGMGKVKYPDGKIIEGEYKLGHPNGMMTVTSKNGQKNNILYSKGAIVNQNARLTSDQVGDPNDANSLLNFDDAKKKCTDIGFKAGTEKFGQCVLKLTK